MVISFDSLLFIDDHGELQANLLPRSLLLMHRWYVTSSELARKLLMIYPTMLKDLQELQLIHVLTIC